MALHNLYEPPKEKHKSKALSSSQVDEMECTFQNDNQQDHDQDHQRQERVMSLLDLRTIDGDSQPTLVPPASEHQSCGVWGLTCDSIQLRLLLFLVMMGILAGAVDLAIREAITGISRSLEKLVNNQSSTSIIDFLQWTVLSLVLVLIAVAWTTKVQPMAIGSGLPEMKSVLSGHEIKGYLTLQTFASKVVGLIAAAASGLSIGREGPFVHITCIIAHQLLRLPFFRDFMLHRSLRLQLLAAAAAVGVAANFSAPLGGVLFSIEVTSTYYLLDNYWKSFLSAIAGATSASIIRALFVSKEQAFEQRFMFPTNFRSSSTNDDVWRPPELVLFVLLGITLGFLGGMFVRGFVLILKAKRSWRRSFPHLKRVWKWGLPVMVSIMTSSVTYWPGTFMRCNLSDCIANLVSEKELVVPESWTSVSSLLFFATTYYLLTPLSITLPIPAGVFIPTFATGAAFGRLAGQLLDQVNLFPSVTIVPGVYAIAGGAAFTASITRTISTAVIALEFTGELELLLPVFLAVLSAYGSGTLICSRSLFEVIMDFRGLPSVPSVAKFIKNQKNDEGTSNSITAGDIMNAKCLYVTQQTSIAELIYTVNVMPRRSVPLVFNEEHPLLLGAVTKQTLMDIVRVFYNQHQLTGVEQDLGQPLDDESDGITDGHSYLRKSLATFRSVFLEERSPSRHRVNVQSIFSPSTTIPPDRQVKPHEHPRQTKSVLYQLMLQSWSNEKQKILERPLDVFETVSSSLISPTVLTVPENASIEDVHVIFVMLRCSKLFVTVRGALVGEITAEQLQEPGNRPSVAPGLNSVGSV